MGYTEKSRTQLNKKEANLFIWWYVYKKPIFKSGYYIGRWCFASFAKLLVSENIVDYIANMYILTDDGGDAIKFIIEFFEHFPCFTQHLAVVAGHCLHHCKSYGGSAMDPVIGNLFDAIGNVLQPGSDSFAPSINSFCSGCCGCVESLDLRFQN